jgi:OmpA-OmpF porin, OOP family
MNKVTRNVKLAAITASLLAVTGFAQAQNIDNWASGSGTTIARSGADASLCWRDSFWTPATAAMDCDGAIKPAPKAAAPAAAPAPAPAPAAAAPVVSSTKVTLLADALFDFDKSVIKPEGAAKLNDLTSKLKAVTVEVIIVIGHTDNIGSLAYNKKLSLKRAEAVKAYLVKNGVEASRVYTEGKAFSEPVADNKTAAGRALNRRAIVEVVGTKKN